MTKNRIKVVKNDSTADYDTLTRARLDLLHHNLEAYTAHLMQTDPSRTTGCSCWDSLALDYRTMAEELARIKVVLDCTFDAPSWGNLDHWGVFSLTSLILHPSSPQIFYVKPPSVDSGVSLMPLSSNKQCNTETRRVFTDYLYLRKIAMCPGEKVIPSWSVIMDALATLERADELILTSDDRWRQYLENIRHVKGRKT